MKHPQPGVGCGPCEWAVGLVGVVGSPAAAQTHARTHTRTHTLLVHATNTTEHPLTSARGGRKGRGRRSRRANNYSDSGELADHKRANIYEKIPSQNESQDMKFGKATDRFCHSFISNKCFNVDFQKLTREKETLPVNNSSDAIRKYYAAFPPLLKDDNNDHRLNIMPAPSWCRKPLESSENKTSLVKDGATASREWLQAKNRKSNNQKIRRNSYHGQRKNSTSKRRCHSFSKSLENETLPEWVTHEGVWDMETQDPVKEFIKALAMDEGYGTCENTMTEDTVSFKFNALECSNIERCGNAALGTNFFRNENLILSTKPPSEEEESLAKFKAKFDRSLEALWSRDQANTPDDECQELPVDFQELLSSPCDDLNSKCIISQTSGRSIWSTSSDHADDYFGQRTNIWSYDSTVKNDKVCSTCDENAISQECMEIIYDKLRPLNLRDDESPAGMFPSLDITQSAIIWEPLKCDDKPDGNLWSDEDTDCEPSSLYQFNEVFDTMPSVTNVMHSLTALNHNKNLSSFTEVIPKWPTGYIGDGRPGKVSYSDSKYRERFGVTDQKDEEDLLNSMKTHFQPIKQESSDTSNGNAVSYVDGMTFSIVSDLEEVNFTRSQSGTMFLECDSEPPKQYMEYRAKLTDKINFKNNSKVFCDESENEFVLKFQVRQIEKAVQTDSIVSEGERNEATPAKKPFLSGRAAERMAEFSFAAANEALANVNRINVNAEEAELVKIQNEKFAKELWKGCEDCKFEDMWKFNANSSRSDANISKIWSSDDGVCQTCGGGESATRVSEWPPGGKSAKEDSREWDELLSDISLARVPRDKAEEVTDGDAGDTDAGTTDDPIARTEISFSAPDGNFVERALEYLRGRRLVPDASPPESERTADDCGRLEAGVTDCCGETSPWRCDRKRRHSATGRGRRPGGKLAALRSSGGCRALCPLPHDAPFLSCCSADRPLTR